MIELNQVSKTYYPGKPNEVIAVKQISLKIAKGDFVIIVGSNGSGKTTLLNLISGSVLPSSGSIQIDGQEVSRLADYKRSKWIARVFQNPLSGTASDLSIIDNFRLAALRTQPKGLTIGVTTRFKNEVSEKIAMLGMGLESKTSQLMGALSGGQRQALTLLMSVMDDCKILLLDEPTAALDPRSAAVVMETAGRLIQQFGLTAILITHNLKDAFTYGSRIIRMGEGAIINDLHAEEKRLQKQSDLFDWFS
jgi:putative ABC transport system ATP-binding protein